MIGRQQLLYCERFVELLTDLLAQLPTRRLMAAVVEDAAVLVKCRLSPLMAHPQGECHLGLRMLRCCSTDSCPHSSLTPRVSAVLRSPEDDIGYDVYTAWCLKKIHTCRSLYCIEGCNILLLRFRSGSGMFQ